MSQLHPKIARIIAVMDPKPKQRQVAKQIDLPWKNMAPFASYHLAKGQAPSLTAVTRDFSNKSTSRSVHSQAYSLLSEADADQFNFQKQFCEKQDWGPIYRA